MNKLLFKSSTYILTGCLLAACGGSRDTEQALNSVLNGDASTNTVENSNQTPLAQAMNSVAAKGQIDGFGSVVVNGVHYESDEATVYINGEPAEELDLDVGYIVRVSGEISEDGMEGAAVRIDYFSTLIGPVSSYDATTQQLTILGQTVAIDRDTLLDEGIGDTGALANLVGQTVEISGFVLTDGPISATRINLHDGDDTLLVTGYTDTLNAESQTFTINGMSFDYSQMPSSDVAAETFQVGESVVVMGSLVDGVFQVTDELTEGSIEDDLELGDSVELSGLVTGYTAGQPFMVDGIPVQISESTEFEFGSADILRDNLLVEVEGYFNDSSVIVSEWVQIHRESDMELEGQIEAVDAQNKTFTLHGLTFTTTQDTQFEDFSAEDEHYFDITYLAVGDAVFVDAFNDPDNAGTRIAALVVRGDEEDLEDDDEDWDDEAWDDDEEFEVEIVGQLTSINIHSLTLSNGIDVTLNELTEFSDYFYPGLLESALGSVVEVGGRFENGVLIAEYIEIEDLCDESLTMIETEEEETQGIGVVMEKACDVDYDEEWDEEEDDLRDEDEHDWDEDEREEDDDAEEEDDMDDEADEDEQDEEEDD